MRRMILMAAALLALTACAATPADPGVPVAPDPAPAPPADPAAACAADAYQVLVGQQIGEDHTDSLPRPNRVYAEGDPITMDHRPDRLNVIVGADGRILAVRCG